MRTSDATRTALVLPTIGLLLLACACGRGGGDTAADESGARSATPVVVQKVQPSSFELKVEVNGSTEAIREVDISAEIGGTVSGFPHELGESLAEGELILSIDSRLYRAAVDQANAGLLAAEAARKQAAREFERAASLKKNGRISDREYEGLELMSLQAESGHLAARAALDQAKLQLEHCEIRAPFAGRLAFKGADRGELVGPGMPVASVVDLSGILLRSSVSERDAVRISKGMPVVLSVPALAGASFRGRVRAIGVRSHRVTRSFDIEIVVDEPAGRILSGMAASAAIVIDRRDHAITIPGTAVIEQYGNPFVFVVSENRAERRAVTLGQRSGESVVVETGLAAGEMLVIKGQWSITDGAPIEIKD